MQVIPGSIAFKAYRKGIIEERHRHRYEFNNKYLSGFKRAGLMITGINPERKLVEIVELADHPWFCRCSVPSRVSVAPHERHALFKDFVAASLNYKQKRELA